MLLASRGAMAQRLAKPVIDTINHHTVRVMNSGPTAWTDTNGWRLVYERTVQPADGAPGEFGNPNQIALLDDGRLVVSELGIRTTPPGVALYDPRGGFVRALGRPGEGPGEYRMVESGVFRDTLMIQDQDLGRATVMTLDGKVVRIFPSTAHQHGEVAVTANGRLQTLKYGRDAKRYLIHFTSRGVRTDSVVAPEAGAEHVWESRIEGGVVRNGIPFAGHTVRHYPADGSIVYGMTDRYELLRSTNGRDTSLIFGRTGVQGAPVASASRDSVYRAMTRDPEVAQVAALRDVPTTYPIWSRIATDPLGNVWVTVGGSPGESIRQFDVFDHAGRYLGAVAAPFRAAMATAWSRDRIAVLDTDENDAPRVRIYHIDRRGH
jgi:hypothetical protein